MIVFSWRQFRSQAIVGAAGLVIVGLVLIVTGPHLVGVYDSAVAACRASGGQNPVCNNNPAGHTFSEIHYGVMALVLVMPALIGMFWGAPLIAHELETGTFRLAWTQSVSRRRWLVIKLALVGFASFLAAGLLSLMASWWLSPLDMLKPDRFGGGNFAVHGFVPGGYAAFAFALGVTSGLFLRRTLPAMGVTLAGFVAARLIVTEWVRAHYMSPAALKLPLSAQSTGFELNGPVGSNAAVTLNAQPPDLPNAWVQSASIVNNAGQAPTASVVQQSCPHLGASFGDPPPLLKDAGKGLLGGHASVARSSGSVQDQFNQCISALSSRYHEVVTYQPANRFWTFQTIETAVFVALALALSGVCVWWVRHRIT